jgi:raffinose/stachyose/melibiose transport system substrate-binding protein
MKYMKQLYDADAFQGNAFTFSDNERNNLFINNGAAMIVQGSWFIGSLKDNKGVDLIPFPYIKDRKTTKNTMIYGLGNGTFYMSKAASLDPKKREASIKLLKALTSKVSAYMFTNQTGMLCNVNSDDMKPNYSPLMLKGRSLLDNADELIGPPDHFVERTVWENTIVYRFPHMLEDKNQPQELWDEAVRIYKINNFCCSSYDF